MFPTIEHGSANNLTIQGYYKAAMLYNILELFLFEINFLNF